MKERLVNVFVYGNSSHVNAIGWRVYEKTGSYDELTAFLRSRAVRDHRIAARQPLQDPLPREEFEVMTRLDPFVGSLIPVGVASENDICCVTHIVNGDVRVDDICDAESPEAVPDYLTAYLSEQGFEFPRLINDDHFEAIHLLWNNRKYVSCLKLVFSLIDTLGFVEYGPNQRNCFTRWLEEYCDFESLGVTSGELWELRNSLIHMTNLNSRKVRSGKAHRLLPRISHPDRDLPPFVDGMKVFHVARFALTILPQGIEKWLHSYNQDRKKFAEFVERYDTIVSEARLVRKE